MATTTARFHINERGEAGPCNAEIKCPLTGDLETGHYPTLAAAQKAYEEQMSGNGMGTVSKQKTNSPLAKNASVVEKLKTIEELEEFANDPANHAVLDELIEDRAERAAAWGRRLDELNKYNNKESKCDYETFKSLKKEFEGYKDRTAMLVEAYVESENYKPSYTEMDDDANVGHAIQKTSYDPGTAEWLRERFDSIGGSDVGTLVINDFSDPKKLMYWDRAGLEKIENSKLAMPTDEEIAANSYASFGSKAGALYRGTVWESRSRDKFAKENPNYKVYNTKSQFKHPERDWQQVNFDGVLSDRADGKPNGILELKTGNDASKWKDGPPANYRAQTLYYLNSSGYEYAEIACVVNDGDFVSYKIHRDDPVWPGKYDKPMESYIQERVSPWFDGLRAKRP